ncbi:MAG: hypothetical protein J6V13_02245 [Paludibacteraceae bacterium]|nr:hypothetical protein [Paludibacteraceae bacterium]
MANLDKWSLFLNNISESVQCIQLFSDQLQKIKEIKDEYLKDSNAQSTRDFLADDIMKYISLTSEVKNEVSRIQNRYNWVLNESIDTFLDFIASITTGDDACLKWVEDGINLILNVIAFKEKPLSLSCSFREFNFKVSLDALRNLQTTMPVEPIIVKLRNLSQQINITNVG